MFTTPSLWQTYKEQRRSAPDVRVQIHRGLLPPVSSLPLHGKGKGQI